MAPPRLLRAGWVVPVSRPPIADGALLIDRGRVADLGPAAELIARHPGARLDDRGADALVVPGLVDAHCHLEWAAMEGLIGPSGFGDWLARFLPLRGRMDRPDDPLVAARGGAARALAAGTTTLADSGPTGAGLAALAATGQRGVVHLEAFGSMAAPAAAAHAATVAGRVTRLAEGAEGEAAAVGLSPHAPYSVGPALWRALAEVPQLATLSWATHIAESPDEERVLADGGGRLGEIFGAMGIPPGAWPSPAAHATVCRRLDAGGALRPGLIAAHCVRLGAGDAALLAARGVRVAHCPRSNIHLQCGRAPLEELRRAGAVVALGTDSPASGGDYDLRAEARACRELHGDSAPADGELLRMITLDGAAALGREGELGHLAPGARGDCVVLRATGPTEGPAVARRVLDRATAVEAVLIGGVVRVEGGEIEDVAVRQSRAACAALTARLR